MPNPASLHVNQPLTQFLVERKLRGFIANRVFPVIAVDKQTDIISEWDTEESSIRDKTAKSLSGPGQVPESIDVGLTTTHTYTAVKHSLARPITDEEVANADQVFQTRLQQGAAMEVEDQLMLIKERELVSLFTTIVAAEATLTTAVTDKWDDGTITDGPITQIRQKVDTVEASSGSKVNAFACDIRVAREILDHPDTQDRMSKGFARTPGLRATEMMEQELAFLLDLDEVQISEVIYNSGPEAGTPAYSRAWGTNALLYARDPNPTPVRPSSGLGYTFGWPGTNGARADGVAIETNREERAKTLFVDGIWHYAQQVTRPSARYARLPMHWFTATLT